ncbi:MAG: hypothetical protein JSU94_19005 [Phycisphaerales bacterium]|nr:MAG: hypothetical protein JSU94_19005 [Phycisphaerales bacterium]
MFSGRKVVLATGVGVVVAVVCFGVVAFLPRPQGSFFEDPLRSILTGFGLLGVASPLCTIGLMLKKRAARSPYFEENFIATVLNVFGFLCLGVGLLCIGLGIFALLKRLLGPG